MLKSTLREVSIYAKTSKPNSAYWVEKTWNQTSSNLGFGLIEDMKEVLLVRDIRSFWKSQYSFQKKILVSWSDVTKHVNGTFDKYLSVIQHYEAMRDHICLVKYEDLVNEPVEVFSHVFQYLGLDFEPEYADTILSIARGKDDHAQYMKTEDQVVPAEFDLESRVAALSTDVREFISSKLAVLGYLL